MPSKIDFSWATVLWKGLKPIVIAALVTAGLSVLDQVVTVDFLAEYGVPQVVAIGLVAAVNNWRKNYPGR